ncbi:MAG TPA: penicillin acylase family protein [Actinomycetes bacterium]|nr:penicillin acylase family protein [Actinomycetes bacterium]
MSSLLTVKLRRDLRAAWPRIALMVVAVGVSLTVFGGVLFAWSAIARETTDAYLSTQPASATIRFRPAIDGQEMAAIAAAARRRPGVIEATGRTQFTSEVKVNRRSRKIPLQLFAAAPDDPMRMARFFVQQGSWPPPPGQIYLRKDSLALLDVAVAKAPNSVEAALGTGFTRLVPVGGLSFSRGGLVTRLLREQPAGWLDRPWPKAIGDALDRVAGRLHERFGHDPAAWEWGLIRPLWFTHPAGGRRPLDRVFNVGPVPGFGDTDTVAQAHVCFTDPTAPAPVMPALRMVIDVGRWDRCRWALPGGQSGNPCSPHYDDQLPLWQRAHGIAIPWTETEVKAATRSTLRLQPAQTPALTPNAWRRAGRGPQPVGKVGRPDCVRDKSVSDARTRVADAGGGM